jgi:hypothetical protein
MLEVLPEVGVRTAAVLGLIALIGLVLSVRSTPAEAGFRETSYTVSIDSVAMNVGEQRFTAVRLTDMSGPVGAWQLDILYDSKVVSLVQCIALADSVCHPDPSRNSFRVAGASARGITVNRTLATISFRCESAASSPLTIHVSILPGIPESFPVVESRDGAVSCGEPAPATVAPSATPAVSLPATGARGRSNAEVGWLIAALMGFGLVAILSAARLRVR